MVLTQEDKDWFTNALDKQKTDLQDGFKETANQLGKRVSRLEHAFSLVSRAARSAVVESAKKDHEALLRQMFDGADLLLIPPYEAGTRKAVSCDAASAQAFVSQYDPNFEVELNRTAGFRLVHKSRSAQVRRKAGATLIQKLKNEAPAKLGLNIQYDKPWELRVAQTAAHKFLRGLKDNSGGLVTATSAKGGFLVLNGVRLAPEYLVPRPHRWDTLFRQVLQKIRSWGHRMPSSTDLGLLTDLFGTEFAADRGVFDLDSLDVHEFDGGLDDETSHGTLHGGMEL